MLIWLGKQMLQQTDKVEQTNSVTVKSLSPTEVQNILKGDPFLNGDTHAGETARITNGSAETRKDLS
jgi:hypothetical protein